MGLWDKFFGELVDIVEWIDESRDTMVQRFERHNNQIKYGAKLIVRESQVAAFINEGVLTDLFEYPGTYTLETKNLPLLSTALGWKYGFESPFKAEVYFVSTRTFTDCKWGTQNPIMLRDSEFGPVRLRAFGSFAVRISDPATFLKQIVGTNRHFRIDQIGPQLRHMMVSRFGDVLGESKIPILDLASNYDELGKFITSRISNDFDMFGIKVVALYVENISLPPEVEQALDKRSSMGIVGNLQAYTQYQAATAMEEAAKNPGGSAGAGIGMGIGMAMGRQIAQGVEAPPAVPGAAPAAAPAVYFLAVEGQQSGPFDVAGLQAKAGSGLLTRETLVWRQGMAQWKPAGAVTDLASLFAALPPPLPPQ